MRPKSAQTFSPYKGRVKGGMFLEHVVSPVSQGKPWMPTLNSYHMPKQNQGVLEITFLAIMFLKNPLRNCHTKAISFNFYRTVMNFCVFFFTFEYFGIMSLQRLVEKFSYLNFYCYFI